MSGVGFSEIIILALIGLIVLGPKRLPQVANQIGSWVGQARRMTRVMKRQLEEELDLETHLNAPPGHIPRDDDGYSPLHDSPTQSVAGGAGQFPVDRIAEEHDMIDPDCESQQSEEDSDEASRDERDA